LLLEQAMTEPTNVLIGAAAKLRSAFEGPATMKQRGRQVALALADIEQALRQRLLALSSEDDGMSRDEDRALIPSPGLERRARGLRHELTDLLERVRALRMEASAMRSDSASDGSDDLGTRLHDLALALERHEHGEIDLVQEAITPDIGAGD
jgi:hypothetical protein